MNQNLITRLGLASGVVAALVALVFVFVIQAASDVRSAEQRANRATAVLVDAAQEGTVPKPQIAGARRAVVQAHRDAADAADRERVLGIGGAAVTALLLLLLTAYLSRYIVVPLRTVTKAASELAEGDLSVRVVEEGDAEPVELARAFNLMAANLQASTDVKDEFFALVSHELRTPLTSIIGYLELVQDDRDKLPEDAARFLEVVERNANRLLRLVGDMLFLAQFEAGRLALEPRAIDLGAVVSQSVEAARPAAERSGVSLTFERESEALLRGDADRLGQMVDNLISNALKFTLTGGRVDVRLRSQNGNATVEVADTGMGIPAAEQARLFERFFRSEAAMLRAVPGAGLGLTIVQTIVEAHHGRISVESEAGVGTTMRVSLPVLHPDVEAT